MTGVILLAAGRGSRMQRDINKVYLRENGTMLLTKSLATFGAMPEVEGIFVVIKAGEEDLAKQAIQEAGLDFNQVKLVVGGKERQDSVRHALEKAPATWDKVLIHDGARPYVTTAVIRRVLEPIQDDIGVIPAVPVKDTIKYVTDGYVEKTPAREHLMRAQTPQGFAFKTIFKLHQQAVADGLTVTDDAALYEAYGLPVYTVLGEEGNEKVTVPEDLSAQGSGSVRIGMGYDVHAFAVDRPLILGGVAIPHHKGLAGHSDADVLTHAVIDALLGAAALGDIGTHFPDTDMRYKGADSLKLLEATLVLLAEAGYEPAQIDVTVCAQRPKLAPYIGEMKANLLRVMQLDAQDLNIKATTTEKLGFVGQEEGIAAYAVATIQDKLA